MNLIQGCRKRGLARTVWSVYGPPGSGKTFCALTLSEHWPDKATIKGRTDLSLQDVLHVAADDGALDGCVELGIDVPSINLKELFGMPDPKRSGKKYDVMNGLRQLYKEIAAYKESNPACKILIVDTVTALDKLIGEYWERNPVIGAGGKPDGFAYWRNLGNSHVKFHTNITALGLSVVYLFHSKALGDAKDLTDKTKRKATQVAGGGSISVDIGGQVGKNVYLGNCSGLFVMHAKRVQGEWVRVLKPVPTKEGFEAKSRFALPDEVEPHLRQLKLQIEKGK